MTTSKHGDHRDCCAHLLLIAALARRPAVERASVPADDRKAEATALLTAELQTHPTNAEAHLMLGSLLAEAGDTASAE